MPILSSYGPYPGGVYYTGSAVAPSELVPAVFPVAIAGHGYPVEWKLFELNFIPLRRPAQEQSREPGETTLNPAGPWPRSQSDWSLGAGQLYLDDEAVPSDLARRRFRTSLGMDVFNDRSMRLLPETEQKRASANTNLKMLRVGTRIYAVDGATLIFSNGSGSEQNPQWSTATGFGWTAATGLPGGNILDIAFSGSHVYVLGSDNSIYRATPGTTSFAGPYYNPTAVATRIFAGLGRLFMSDGRSLYEVTATPGETLIFTHPDPNYVLSALSAAPTGVYFAGNVGTDFGEVRHTWVRDDGTAFVAPVVAAEFINEQVHALRTAGNNMVFGTSVGLRYAPIDNLATGLDFGPAIEIGAVRDLVIDSVINPDGKLDTFAWGTWTNINSSSSSGLVKVRLTRQTEPNVPAYAADIYTVDGGTVLCVASISNRRYFGSSAVGFYGATLNPVATGTLSTGRIRFGILETKVFTDLKWRTEPLIGSISAEADFDTGTSISVGEQASAGTVTNEFSSIGPIAAEWGEITFSLNRGGRTRNALKLDGGSETASTPDHANFAITDLDVWAEISPTDWTPGGLGEFIIGQWPNVAGNNGWAFAIDASGTLNLSFSPDGTATQTRSSTAVPAFADGETHFVRVTLDVDNGSGQNVTSFYTSTNGSTWTLLGAQVIGTGTTAIFNSTTTLSIGAVLAYTGLVYKAELRASIDGAAVANPDFTRQAAGVTSFADTASTPKTWTVNSTATIESDQATVIDWSPELRWWRMRAVPAAEETMQFIVPIMLMEKVQMSYGASHEQDFLEELAFLMALSNSKQIVSYQMGNQSYAVYVNSISVKPTRWNPMDQTPEGIVSVELHSLSA